MKNFRASFLKALLPFGALLAIAPFGGCIDAVIIGGNDGPCTADSDCVTGLFCSNGVCKLPGNEDGPEPEVCNGFDDDLDGQIDATPNGPVVCADGSICVNGVCGGQVQCNEEMTCPPNSYCNESGMCVLIPACSALPEQCDGLDNDCDGQVDEQNPGTVLCPNGGACVAGACVVVHCMTDAECPPGQLCNPMAAVCVPGGCVPAPEACNGLDDDCNGITDDNAFCADGSACVNGQCGGMCSPTPEYCNNIDDDCDGLVDDPTPGGLSLCPNGGTCVNGMCAIQGCMTDANCPAGHLCDPATGTCVNPSGCVPQSEVCNGIDDDCDGQIDEQNPGGGSACNTGLPGICAVGMTACQNGVIVCNQINLPTVELCDGMDNDCNGMVDEVTPGSLFCPAPQICLNGNCTILQCASNADCPAATTCQNGLCK